SLARQPGRSSALSHQHPWRLGSSARRLVPFDHAYGLWQDRRTMAGRCPRRAIGRRNPGGLRRGLMSPTIQEAEALLPGNVSAHLHGHPGITRRGNTLATHLDHIARGGLKVAMLAAVGDMPVLRAAPTGGYQAARAPSPGELYASTYAQL